MQEILIDACGWVAIIDSGMNLDSELRSVTGPYQFILLPDVEKELDKLQQQRGRKNPLLLALLKQKSREENPIDDNQSHTDDQLLLFSEHHKIPILTVDVELKRRAYEKGISVLEVAKNKRINLIEGI